MDPSIGALTPRPHPLLLSRAAAGLLLGQSSLRARSGNMAPQRQGCEHPLPCHRPPRGFSCSPGPPAPQNRKQDSNPFSPQLQLLPSPSPQKGKKPSCLHLGAWAPPLCASGFPAPGEGLWWPWLDPRPGPHSILAARPWAGTGKSIPYKHPPSMTPSGTRLGPQVPQHPSAGGSPAPPSPQSPEPSPTCYCWCQGTSNLGLDHTPSLAVSTPYLYSPSTPQGPLDAARDPAGLGQ